MNPKADVHSRKNLILLGAAMTVLISIAHSLEFRLDVWSPATLLSWYGLSLLMGGVSGLVTGWMAARASIQVHRFLLVGTVAVLSTIGYLLQVSVLLFIVFRMVTWE